MQTKVKNSEVATEGKKEISKEIILFRVDFSFQFE